MIILFLIIFSLFFPCFSYPCVQTTVQNNHPDCQAIGGFPGAPNSCVESGCFENPLSCYNHLEVWDSNENECVTTINQDCFSNYNNQYSCGVTHGIFWYNSDCCPGAIVPAGLITEGCETSLDMYGCSSTLCSFNSLFECSPTAPDDCSGSPCNCDPGKVCLRISQSGCFYTCNCANRLECNLQGDHWDTDEFCNCVCVLSPELCTEFPFFGVDTENCRCGCAERAILSCPDNHHQYFDYATCTCIPRCIDDVMSISCKLNYKRDINKVEILCDVNYTDTGHTGYKRLSELGLPGTYEWSLFQIAICDENDVCVPTEDYSNYDNWQWYCNDIYSSDDYIDGNIISECEKLGAILLEEGRVYGYSLWFDGVVCPATNPATEIWIGYDFNGTWATPATIDLKEIAQWDGNLIFKIMPAGCVVCSLNTEWFYDMMETVCTKFPFSVVCLMDDALTQVENISPEPYQIDVPFITETVPLYMVDVAWFRNIMLLLMVFGIAGWIIRKVL